MHILLQPSKDCGQKFFAPNAVAYSRLLPTSTPSPAPNRRKLWTTIQLTALTLVLTIANQVQLSSSSTTPFLIFQSPTQADSRVTYSGFERLYALTFEPTRGYQRLKPTSEAVSTNVFVSSNTLFATEKRTRYLAFVKWRLYFSAVTLRQRQIRLFNHK